MLARIRDTRTVYTCKYKLGMTGAETLTSAPDSKWSKASFQNHQHISAALVFQPISMPMVKQT